MDYLNAYSDSSPSTSPLQTPPRSPLQSSSTKLKNNAERRLTPSWDPESVKHTRLVSGVVEHVSFNETEFAALERSLDVTGATVDPRSGNVVVSAQSKRPRGIQPRLQRVSGLDENSALKRARTTEPVVISKSVESNQTSVEKNNTKTTCAAPFLPTSEFHARDRHDYQNRSWIKPESSARTFAQLETYTPYIPKRTLLSVPAHEGGISCTNFFPHYGHLLLSAGLDGSACMWSTDRMSRMRTYRGHTKGVRDATFSPTGDTFLTASYDRHVRLWDTESGRVIGSYSMTSTPLCVRFSPLHNGVEFLAACSDKKVIQIDTRDAAKIVQQYDQHMGAVNSIAFIDDDRRFVSSCEDKVLRVWEYGMPVVIRYVSDPAAHSIPYTTLHPNRKWLICQSMDNTIRIFAAREKFKPYPKKLFKGHLVAGYACGLGTSPDGRFVASGDGMGRLFFWDWKSTRLFRVLEGHKGVCSTVRWHPTKSSLIVSGGWDGQLMFWD